MDTRLGCGWLVLVLFFLLLHHSFLPPFTFLDHTVYLFLNTRCLFVHFASSGSPFHSSTTLKPKLFFLTSVIACFLVIFHGLEDCLVFWVVLRAGNNFSGSILSIPFRILNTWVMSWVFSLPLVFLFLPPYTSPHSFLLSVLKSSSVLFPGLFRSLFVGSGSVLE
jgi:hypothetical protein